MLTKKISRTDWIVPFSFLIVVFFLAGFAATIKDVVSSHLQTRLSLGYSEAAAIQVAFFSACLVTAPLIGTLVVRIGYRHGVFLGLLLGGIGFIGSAFALSYSSPMAVIIATFVAGAGTVVIAVTGNASMMLLGDQKTASFRFNIAQGFVGAGMVLAPALSSMCLFHPSADMNVQLLKNWPLRSVEMILFALGCCWLLCIIFLYSVKNFPKPLATTSKLSTGFKAVFGNRFLTYSFLAAAIYVGAEMGIGAFLTKFLAEPGVIGIPIARGAFFTSLYWGGAVIGRFVESALPGRFGAGRMIIIHGLVGAILLSIAVFSSGMVAAVAIIACGFANSILYPTILGTSLAHSGKAQAEVAGILLMANIGGALIPFLQGVVADKASLSIAFLLPVVCYLGLVAYGFKETQMHRAKK